MKTKPQTELKVVASVMMCLAVTLLGTLSVSIPGYRFLVNTPWEKIFRSEAVYQSFLTVYRWIVLGQPLALAAVFLLAALSIFRNLKRMRDGFQAANPQGGAEGR